MKRFFVILCFAPAVASADVDFAVYGDVDGHLQTEGTRTSTTDSFSAANVDLFATGRQGRWSFLSEINFEANEFNEFEVDAERLAVVYTHADWLRLMVGRFPVAMGYYNDAVNHGAIFALPATRAVMVRFEDEGGLAPSHSVGVHADGRFGIGDGHLRYDLEIGNGRSSRLDIVQVNHDTNRAKSVNLRLRYELGGAFEGLVVGANAMFDSIPAPGDVETEVAVPLSNPPIHEWIFGAHAAYTENGNHLVAEALVVRHVDIPTGVAHVSNGAFLEVGHTFDKLTPYMRYERVRYPIDGDKYFIRDHDESFDAFTVGARHAANENIVLKIEGSVTRYDDEDIKLNYLLDGQIAFGF